MKALDEIIGVQSAESARDNGDAAVAALVGTAGPASATRNVPGERKTFPGNVFRFYRSRNGELGTVTTQKRFKSFNYLIIQLSLR